MTILEQKIKTACKWATLALLIFWLFGCTKPDSLVNCRANCERRIGELQRVNRIGEGENIRLINENAILKAGILEHAKRMGSKGYIPDAVIYEIYFLGSQSLYKVRDSQECDSIWRNYQQDHLEKQK